MFFYINTGGKPITPNDVTDSLTNGHTTTENGGVAETVTKAEVSIDINRNIIHISSCEKNIDCLKQRRTQEGRRAFTLLSNLKHPKMSSFLKKNYAL